ncbi:esterase/lipase family protein [Actinomadura sp. 6N118]|uniref:esterase/lipase family protein n=1 Tax=Actinomadura sp. 6N118 TaxID=3375151 RepID=UPI00378E8611
MEIKAPGRPRWAARIVAATAIAMAATLQAAPALSAPTPATRTTPLAAAAAPARADKMDRAVYFVHGYQRSGGVDCKMWNKTKDHFKNKKWTGNLITWGFYKADKNCTVEYGGDKDTDLKNVSKSLAWNIYNNYTRKGKTVDVVAFSMGGLVIRNAIARVKRGHAGFPSSLYVEDVVTLGTPHRGSDAAYLCGTNQCKQLRPTSAHLKWLNGLPNSNFQATGGTNWTVMSSYADDAVTVYQATAFHAQHKITYPSSEKVEHDDYYKTGTGSAWTCSHSPNYGRQYKSYKNCPGPINSAFLAAYRHSSR